MLVLALPNGSTDEIHECLKAGGQVVRPQVLDVQGLGEMAPLTRTMVVDPGTTATLAQQDGSMAFPFATVAQAVVQLTGVGGVVLLVPGSYTEPSIVIPAATPIALVCIGLLSATACQANFTNPVSSSTDLAASNCAFTSISSTNRLFLDNCNCSSNCTAGTGASVLWRTFVLGTLTCTGTMTARSSIFGGSTNLSTLQSQYCQWASCTTSASAVINFSSFSGAVSVGTNAVVINSTFGGALTVTGSLTTDYKSIAPGIANVTAGSVVLTSAPICPKITVSVAVPALAAGNIGYVDVALGATKLAGFVATNSMLTACPTVDLVAAGAGGGFINVRASAANTARFAFLGPLAGGASNFILGVI